MAFPFVFGDSYGGVQGAQQADVNSDRNFTMSLLAAQQQAQRMAMEQSNQNALFNQGIADRQSQQAQHAYEFNANLDQAEKDRALREELGLGGLDVSERRIYALQDQYERKLSDAHDEKLQQAQSAGPVLASRFAELIKANKSAEEDLAKAAGDALKTEQERAALVDQNLVKVVRNDKGLPVYRAMGDEKDAAAQARADKLNADIRATMAAVNEAKARKQQAEHDFQTHMRMIQSTGFIPGDNGLVFPKTGQVFPISLPKAQPNSQRIRIYNPVTGLQ